MPFTPGLRLGPYEIRGQIGEGGMGVVYRARDTRLGREVALKVLPQGFADDPDRLRRFEQEARAVGSLNHPNILALFDTGSFEGAPYLVMELLEGETLREKLGGKPFGARRAVDLTLQVAQGLAAAHERGIVHRDLKPENIFITRDGRVKLLDFGLAKSILPGDGDGTAFTEQRTAPLGTALSHRTAMGTVVGTVSYMSPEQAAGKAVDGRSDLFSLGVVLWEMLTGEHPFRAPSAVETLHAILKEEPPEPAPGLAIPPLLDKVLRTCLAKDPAGRFHSAHDLAFALEATTFDTSSAIRVPAPGRRRLRALLGAALGAAALLAAFGLAWAAASRAAPPSFTRLTFAPGTVESAFFSGDGRSTYFCGRFQGRAPEVFLKSPESPDPRPLDTQGARLAGVSASNDLAVLRDPAPGREGPRGVLSRMAGNGGTGRELQEEVDEAAWDSAGQDLACITRDEGFNQRVEYPAGKVLYSTLGQLKHLRVSRSGNRIAVVEGTGSHTNLLVFEGGGSPRILTVSADDIWADTFTGLAWHPGGKEVWISEKDGSQSVLWALDLKGGRRMVWRGPGTLRLLDIGPDGKVLAAMQQARRGVYLQRAGDAAPLDLSIYDGTQALAFLPDGKSLLLRESPALDGGTARDEAYLRRIDGSPALRLARGNPRSLSRDGKFVGMQPEASSPDAEAMVFAPTGPGRPFALSLPPVFTGVDDWLLFDQGRRILFAGLEKDRNWRFYTLDRQGGAPKPFTPLDVRAPKPLLLSPDERYLIGRTSTRGAYVRYPLDGGEPLPVKGLLPHETPAGWSRDGRVLYVAGGGAELPVKVTALDPATGARRPLAAFTPPDPSGYRATVGVCVAPDASALAVTYERDLGELYLIEGLR